MLAILEKPELRRHALPISVAGYEKMAELGLVDEKTELIRGVIFEKMSKSPLHSGLVRLFIRNLKEVLSGDCFVDSEQPLRLADSCVEPDIAVISGSEDDYLRRHPTTARFIIEVAISSGAIDREKALLYAEADVAEYWIVLPENGTIEQFSQPAAGRYTKTKIITYGEMAVSLTFPTFVINLSRLLADSK